MCPSLRCAWRRPASARLQGRCARAVAFVAHTHRVGGGGGAADRGVDGVQALVVPLGGVTGVDGLVAEAVVLGSGKASLLTRVEGHGEARHEEAEAPLAQGAEVGGGDGGAAHGGVGEAHQEGACAGLGAGDEARCLAAGDRRTHVGSVEPVTGLERVEPRRRIDDSAERALWEAR